MLEHALTLRWVSSFVTALTMAASVFGWLGAFVHGLSAPSPRARDLADASYWIYVAHLPVVVALQVALAGTGWPWWVRFPLVCVTTLGVLLATYQAFVRSTWIGAWLNGRRQP